MEIPENLIAKDIKEILDLVKSGLKMKGKVSVEFSARIFFQNYQKTEYWSFLSRKFQNNQLPTENFPELTASGEILNSLLN